MITNNSWIRSNIWEVSNQGDPFVVKFYPYKFKPLPFMKAAEYTAELIAERYGSNGLCLGLSGGADSEFIARLFTRLRIPFTPIVVMSELNNEDIINAMQICEELDLKPVIIRTTEQQIIDYYFKHFFFKRNDGITHVHQMLVNDKAREFGAWAVLGETHIFDPEPQSSVVRAFKFVPDLYDSKIIPFYYFTLELTYAEMNEVRMGDYATGTWPEEAQAYKARVRGTRKRTHKSLPAYKINQKYHEAVKFLQPDWLSVHMGTPPHFMKQMEPYIE